MSKRLLLEEKSDTDEFVFKRVSCNKHGCLVVSNIYNSLTKTYDMQSTAVSRHVCKDSEEEAVGIYNKIEIK